MDLKSNLLHRERKNPGQFITIPSGCRKTNVDLSTWSNDTYNPSLPRIRKEFRHRVRHKKLNHCVWLSACMLVYVDDHQCYKLMMEYLSDGDNSDRMELLTVFQ